MRELETNLNFQLDNEDIQHAGVDLDTLDNVGLLLQGHDQVFLPAVHLHPWVQAVQGGGVDVVEDLQRDDHAKVTQGLEPGQHLSLNIWLRVLQSQGYKSMKDALRIRIYSFL